MFRLPEHLPAMSVQVAFSGIVSNDNRYQRGPPGFLLTRFMLLKRPPGFNPLSHARSKKMNFQLIQLIAFAAAPTKIQGSF